MNEWWYYNIAMWFALNRIRFNYMYTNVGILSQTTVCVVVRHTLSDCVYTSLLYIII